MIFSYTLLGWTAAVLGFGFLVFFHELGHFLALKALKLPVHAFSIGFGQPLWKAVVRGTEIRVGWLPLGGYVMPEDPEEMERREALGEPLLPDHSPWEQFFVAIMGPAANFFMAFLLFSALMYGWGEPKPVPVVESAMKGSPASVAGLIPGDKLVQFNERQITTWQELIGEIQKNELRPGHVRVLRSGQAILLPITPIREGERFVLGIRPHMEPTPPADLATAIRMAAVRTMTEVIGVFDALSQLLSFSSANHVSGPIAILGFASDAAQGGMMAFLSFLALLSINLAVFNLLPIPPLDGLRILIASWHFVRGKPPQEKVLLPIYQWGALGLALLFVFVTLKDLGNLL